MVSDWFRRLGPAKTGCGPLCRDVHNEVDSIGRAEAIARYQRKQKMQRRGTREK